jgi:hypothetical protein
MSRRRPTLIAAVALALLGLAGPAQGLAWANGPKLAMGFSSHRPRPTPTPTPAPTPTPGPTPWQVVASPSPDPLNNTLSAVAAISATDVWAVGQTGVSTLAEHWNGSAWTVVPTPNGATTGVAQNALLAVAAISSSDVWAVGYSIGASYATLAIHWDGSSWSLIPTPSPATREFIDGPILDSITAVSSTDVWAVGGQLTGHYESPAVIEHWDGRAWSLVSAGALDSVQCLCSLSWVAGRAANDVWAGGVALLHWDGTAWSQAAAAAGQGETAASASSTSNVWAVGSFSTCVSEGGCFSGPTADRFDGSAWSSHPPANPSGTEALRGVVALGPADVWAVGQSALAARTLAEHWDGSTWTVVATPNVGPVTNGINILNAVAGASGVDLWAVGTYDDADGASHTLIERYAGR